ncbi:uncharacterized protein L201_006962 [Kwoniella dendrophila CBS 6074]|uniref:BRCT domain-containing protein n=1 Tax=Kwoniella dendrophila CBS 6074 TaxID=1295534 RepID=A0AAX4K5I4_9TREE
MLFQDIGFYVHHSSDSSGEPSHKSFLDVIIESYGGSIYPIPSKLEVQIILIDLPESQPRCQNYLIPLDNNSIWMDPEKLDQEEGWTPELLIRYFEDTIRDSVRIKGRKVVLGYEWIKTCLKVQKVLGQEDDWGGWRVRGTYDPLFPQHQDVIPTHQSYNIDHNAPSFPQFTPNTDDIEVVVVDDGPSNHSHQSPLPSESIIPPHPYDHLPPSSSVPLQPHPMMPVIHPVDHHAKPNNAPPPHIYSASPDSSSSFVVNQYPSIPYVNQHHDIRILNQHNQYSPSVYPHNAQSIQSYRHSQLGDIQYIPPSPVSPQPCYNGASVPPSSLSRSHIDSNLIVNLPKRPISALSSKSVPSQKSKSTGTSYWSAKRSQAPSRKRPSSAKPSNIRSRASSLNLPNHQLRKEYEHRAAIDRQHQSMMEMHEVTDSFTSSPTSISHHIQIPNQAEKGTSKRSIFINLVGIPLMIFIASDIHPTWRTAVQDAGGQIVNRAHARISVLNRASNDPDPLIPKNYSENEFIRSNLENNNVTVTIAWLRDCLRDSKLFDIKPYQIRFHEVWNVPHQASQQQDKNSQNSEITKIKKIVLKPPPVIPASAPDQITTRKPSNINSDESLTNGTEGNKKSNLQPIIDNLDPKQIADVNDEYKDDQFMDFDFETILQNLLGK